MIKLTSAKQFNETESGYTQIFCSYTQHFEMMNKDVTRHLVLNVSKGSAGSLPKDNEGLQSLIGELSMAGKIKDSNIAFVSQAYLDFRNEAEQKEAKAKKEANKK